jgi:hypothetical protein
MYRLPVDLNTNPSFKLTGLIIYGLKIVFISPKEKALPLGESALCFNKRM